jgi:hypothetical protein
MDNLTKFNILLLTLTLAVFSYTFYLMVKVDQVKDEDKQSKEKLMPLVYFAMSLLIIVPFMWGGLAAVEAVERRKRMR